MAIVRPFRFSLSLGSQPYETLKGWLEGARRAEELGYTTLVLPDHMYVAVDPVPGLLAAANATSLRIASHVFCNDFRHPILLAREAANLDFFSEGRFQLGIGCGYLAEEYGQLGIPLDPVGVRMSRFEEAVQIIKQYFHKEEVTFSGKYYQIQGLKTIAKAVQKPHPPIYIGGGGKRVLSFAAREADIVGLAARNNAHGLDWSTALSEANLEKVQWIREAAGERFAELEFSTTVFIVAVTDHGRGAAQGISQRVGLAPEQVFDCTHMLVGSVEQIVEELQRRREVLGISSIEIPRDHMETFAPVVARLAGK
jgi:probable F420-dependent oxidoreductase